MWKRGKKRLISRLSPVNKIVEKNYGINMKKRGKRYQQSLFKISTGFCGKTPYFFAVIFAFMSLTVSRNLEDFDICFSTC